MAAKDIRALDAYAHQTPIQTRWMDNDIYGHVNNVVYYSYFDTAVNGHLLDSGVLDIHGGAVIGLVVETSCSYHAPIAFPDKIIAGIGISHIGTSSVRYEIGLFDAETDVCVANGYFVHVYVSRESRKPVALPDDFRAVVSALKFQD